MSDFGFPLPEIDDAERHCHRLLAASTAGPPSTAATAVPFVASFAPSERARRWAPRWKSTSPTSRRAA